MTDGYEKVNSTRCSISNREIPGRVLHMVSINSGLMVPKWE